MIVSQEAEVVQMIAETEMEISSRVIPVAVGLKVLPNLTLVNSEANAHLTLRGMSDVVIRPVRNGHFAPPQKNGKTKLVIHANTPQVLTPPAIAGG